MLKKLSIAALGNHFSGGGWIQSFEVTVAPAGSKVARSPCTIGLGPRMMVAIFGLWPCRVRIIASQPSCISLPGGQDWYDLEIQLGLSRQ